MDRPEASLAAALDGLALDDVPAPLAIPWCPLPKLRLFRASLSLYNSEFICFHPLEVPNPGAPILLQENPQQVGAWQVHLPPGFPEVTLHLRLRLYLPRPDLCRQASLVLERFPGDSEDSQVVTPGSLEPGPSQLQMEEYFQIQSLESFRLRLVGSLPDNLQAGPGSEVELSLLA